MSYTGELQMLCETFQKCRIPTAFIRPDTIDDPAQEELFRALFGQEIRPMTQLFLNQLEPQTIYRLNTPFRFTFLFLRLPPAQETVLAIGPYLPAALQQQQLLEIAEAFNVPPQRRKLLENYYANLPILPDTSHLFPLLETFAEQLWGINGYSFEIINKNKRSAPSRLPTDRNDGSDLLAQMKIMEERYEAENALIRAVSRGQLHKLPSISSQFSFQAFEHRLTDPLRNLKNFSIIMNTLLRKAAEQGGVHPLYLDEISSAFAARIEQIPSVNSGRELMGEMFRSYCLLVRKHRTKNYSSAVQKALAIIDADLSAELSLQTLATALNISPSYLSSVFKKEIGKTLTDYINNERMELATHLLETTRLQVQTVAAHCGILDVQYFSKVFKKYIGKTPKEYRESLK